MALTNTYVDPSIAANSGTGTIGDPYGDLQYALDTMTRDATNGDQVNVKAGTDEILAAALSLATYGTPTGAAPLVIKGYTAAANDGGIGGISGAATYSIINSTTLDHIEFHDMHLHNCGAAQIVRLDNFATFINCEVNGSSGGGLYCNTSMTVIGCYIYNTGSQAIRTGTGGVIYGNHIEYGANSFTTAVWANQGVAVCHNIVKVDGSAEGIRLSGNGAAINNSIWANGGTGTGIFANIAGSNAQIILNNIVEGFSGAGAEGYLAASNTPVSLYGNNKAYNNTTNFSVANVITDLGGNEALTTSPFRDAANDDFRITPYVASLLGWPADFNGSPTVHYPYVGAAIPDRFDPRTLRARSREIT